MTNKPISTKSTATVRPSTLGHAKILAWAAMALLFLTAWKLIINQSSLSTSTPTLSDSAFSILFDSLMPASSDSTPTAGSVDPFLNRDVLPANVKPVHYRLRLEPNFSTFKFQGQVEIDLKVLKTTREISLNAVELEFVATVLKVAASGKNKVIQPSSQDYDKMLETMKYSFDEDLPAGSDCTLVIDFIGTHNEKMAGFYKSVYEDRVSGEKKYMVVSQFEPTDARKAFPCWDEPALKATFDITLVVPAHMTALSNMNDISTIARGAEVKEVKFATTPIMSTYLVAFVVGELDHVETHTADERKTLCRVFTPKGLAHEGEFALGVAAKTLEFFADYFGNPYPLPKMDMVAIPDFAAGAMENWGLVTYRTVYLLFDEKVSAAKSKQQIAYVVGHELAHQWFGNLVSPGWWSDLWLNEGFATWAGWLVTDHIFPDWNVWTAFVNDDFQRGLGLDSLRSSHPIEVPVKNPSEIHQIFDAISYSKGASVIRMLANYLGAEDFRQGVRQYLQDFKYRNAATKDLWEHLSAAAGYKPVGKLMNSWTRQTGFPVISAVRAGDNSIKVRQERFLSSGDVAAADDEAVWFVPLQIVTSAKPNAPTSDVLSEKEAVITVKDLALNSLGDADFFKLNFAQSGFYRTKYEPELLKKLGNAIRAGKFGSSDRIGILTDTFALSRAGLSSVVDGLELLGNFVNEDDYIVWSEIASEMTVMRSVWWESSPEVTSKLKTITRTSFSKVAKQMGWEYNAKESFLSALLRTLAISQAGRAGDQEIIAEAQKRFKSFAAGKTDALHPNLRGAVFAIVLQNGGKTEYEQVLKLYRETTTADQKLIALSSLGATEDPALLKRTLEYGLTDQVRPQDVMYVFSSVASNPAGKKLAWEFVKANWQTFYDRYYSGSMSILSRIVSSTTDSFSSDAWYTDVEKFFQGKELTNINRSIQQSLEKIKSNSMWYSRDAKAVEAWLSKNIV